LRRKIGCGTQKSLRLGFSNDGTYLYRLNLDNIPTLSKVNFYKQTLAGIEETEDKNIYHEFRIKSHPEIFN
jgi:hypothetical protein